MGVFYTGSYNTAARGWQFLGQAPVPEITPSAVVPKKDAPSVDILGATLAVAGIAAVMVVMSGAFSNRD